MGHQVNNFVSASDPELGPQTCGEFYLKGNFSHASHYPMTHTAQNALGVLILADLILILKTF